MVSGPMFSDRLYRWRRQFFRWGIWNIAYRFWIKLHVEGWENVPAEGPAIIMGNHIAAADPGVIVSFYPDRDIVPIAKIETLSTPVLRFFVSHWGAIPINRGEADLKALKTAVELIQRNYVLMLYAEGTRSHSGLIQGQEGSAYIALKTDALIIPAAIWGTESFPKKWIREFHRTHVYLRFGQPFKLRHEGGKLPREHFRAMTDEAMYRISELLPPHLRGMYNDLSQATAEFLDFDVTWRPATRALPRRALDSNLARA